MDGLLSAGNFSFCFFDNFFILCYWEWLEYVLSRNKERLIEWRLYDKLYASLFSNDVSLTVLKNFNNYGAILQAPVV